MEFTRKELFERLITNLKILRDKRANVRPWLELARENQLPPSGDDWLIWMILAGRGFGKTRAGSETVKMWVDAGKCRRIALIGDTIDEVREVMVEGKSGLLSVSALSENGVIFEPSKRRLAWRNGAEARIYSAESYEKLRGPEFDLIWMDELAKFRNDQETFDQALLSLRIGKSPKLIITTTPRPTPLINSIIKRSDAIVTKGSTYENSANLSKDFIKQIREKFDGTELGRQEIYAEILNSNARTLWNFELIDAAKKIDFDELFCNKIQNGSVNFENFNDMFTETIDQNGRKEKIIKLFSEKDFENFKESINKSHINNDFSNQKQIVDKFFNNELNFSKNKTKNEISNNLMNPKNFNKIFDKIIISVDPAVTNGESSDETGIIVLGCGFGGTIFVIEDASTKADVAEWADLLIFLYYKYDAMYIVVETNAGGDLIEQILKIKDQNIMVKKVFAKEGKISRAEPIVRLYKQGKIKHLGDFAKLEKQMLTFEAGMKSPDRMDALVWGVKDLEDFVANEPKISFL